MAEDSTLEATPVAGTTRRRTAGQPGLGGPWRIFAPLGVLVAALALVGFWRTYFGLMAGGRLDVIPLVHLHAAVMMGWVGLFTMQATLAATGRLALHVRLGPWIMAFGVVVIVMGLALAFEKFGEQISAGHLRDGQRRLFGPLRDMAFFTPYLAACWTWRRKPEVHKRLMFATTTLLLLPAVSRMIFLGRPVPEPIFMLVWPTPIYIAMVYDYVTRRRIHPVYVITVIAMLAMRLSLPLRDTDAWLRASRWLAGLNGV